MVVVELTGGVGNQLFQYATAFAAARRADTRLRLDVRHYDLVVDGLPSRPYRLNRFCITAEVASVVDKFRTKHLRLGRSRVWLRRAIDKAVRPKLLVDAAEGDDPRLRHPPKDVYLRGCWQTEKLFSDYRRELLEELRFRDPPSPINKSLMDEIKSSTSICVHFRRTDYLVETTLLRPCSLDYYQRAFQITQATFPGAKYYVFTDDADWVKANADLPTDTKIITHNTGVDDVEDLRLMASCDHFIIANSSFSWWGAWLAQGAGKSVIAPDPWYQQGHGSERDLVPESWQRV